MKTPAFAAPASPARRAPGTRLASSLSILGMIAALAGACSGDAKSTSTAADAKPAADVASKTADDASKTATPAAAAAAFVAPYLTIQETLADDSVDKLAELAAAVVTGADAAADKPGVSELLAGAGRVPAQDIETARVGFEKMSMGVISFLKANPDQQGGLQVIFCPMAFNNKGAYWVQKAGEVNNPYHGKMMLRCGDAVEWAKAPG